MHTYISNSPAGNPATVPGSVCGDCLVVRLCVLCVVLWCCGVVIFGGTVRCAHCSIHGRSFWSPLGVILVTLGSILVALGSILVTLGSPGDPRGTLWDQWQDFWWNFRILGPPLGTHFGTFSAKNRKKKQIECEKVDAMKNVTQKSWNGTSQNLKNRCFTIVKHRFPWIPPTHQKSSKWGALEVILRAFWSQVVHFRGKKVLLKKWWKNESKKRPQSEKTDLLVTMGRRCVALKETPEATGQRPETTGQTP